MMDIGDFGPDFGLPDQHGSARSLYSQEIAGCTNALFFLENTDEGVFTAALAYIAENFSASDARPVVITPLPPDATRQLAGRAEFSVLSDPDRGLIGRIAGGRPSQEFGVAVFDRNGRLLAAGVDEKLAPLVDGAREICVEQAARYETGITRSQAPVLLIPRILEPAECERLIEFWAGGEKRENEISTGQLGDSVHGASSDVKRRTDVLVPQDDNPINAMIRHRVNHRIVPELAKAFNFEARAYDIGRIGCYDAADSGFFRPHRDIQSYDVNNPRKFALSLNLNDDFTGGALRFAEYGERTYLPAKGDGIVFSCAMLHEALPVTSGKRFGLFLFFN